MGGANGIGTVIFRRAFLTFSGGLDSALSGLGENLDMWLERVSIPPDISEGIIDAFRVSLKVTPNKELLAILAEATPGISATFSDRLVELQELGPEEAIARLVPNVETALFIIKAIISLFRLRPPCSTPMGLLHAAGWYEAIAPEKVRAASDEALLCLAIGALLGYVVGGIHKERPRLSTLLSAELSPLGFWENQVLNIDRDDPHSYFPHHQVPADNSDYDEDASSTRSLPELQDANNIEMTQTQPTKGDRAKTPSRRSRETAQRKGLRNAKLITTDRLVDGDNEMSNLHGHQTTRVASKPFAQSKLPGPEVGEIQRTTGTNLLSPLVYPSTESEPAKEPCDTTGLAALPTWLNAICNGKVFDVDLLNYVCYSLTRLSQFLWFMR